MIRSVLKDPFLLRQSSRYMAGNGRTQQRNSAVHACISGALDGLAMLSLIPIATVISTGEPQFGLDITGWLLVLGALAILGGVFRYLGAHSGYLATLEFMRGTHERIGVALSTLPLGWFRAERTGELSRLVTKGFMSAGEALAHITNAMFSNTATLLVIVLGSWIWEPRLGLTLTLLAPLAAAVMVFAQSLKRRFADAVTPSEQDLAHRIVEFATCQPAIRAAGRSKQFAPLQESLTTNNKAVLKELWLSLIPLMLNGMFLQFFVVSIITVTSFAAVEGSFTPLETIVFIGLTLRFTQNLQELGAFMIGVDTARPPLQEMAEIIDAPTLPEPASPTAGDKSGRIEFSNVTFGYHPEQPVLQDISFTAEPGQVTAIVGPSGSGKTTIARLISRFWDTDRGSISVDGVNILQIGTEALMAKLSMVFQDVYLFNDTLEANIRVGRPDATDAEVRAAATLAGVDTIAEHLPDGWNTKVGEGGRSLSGGERQRVSVARALIKQAPIVLFDEATSALDAENERNILAAMEQLRAQSTFLVIAHKLDTVRTADKIIVLDECGKIAEQGTHAELFEAHGPYRAFWDRRLAATGWSLTGRK
ncbi:MAG: ABC transporter ATP-binding protein [Corynebacterium sp.]|nr:ABC transporter ATP-binding protein [Corynebacterium sp.]